MLSTALHNATKTTLGSRVLLLTVVTDMCSFVMGKCASVQLEVITASLQLWNHLSDCTGEVALDEPDLDVCLAHIAFFVISAISSETAWGKGHPSTKWSNPHT